MASLLRRCAYNLTRSVVPTRPLAAISVAENMSQRSPFSSCYFPKKPWIPASRPEQFNGNRSYILTPVGAKQRVMQVPGLEIDKAESDKGLLHVSLNVDRAKDAIARIDGNHLLIQCSSADGVTRYLAGIKIPFTCNEKRGLKGMTIKDGRLTVTLPTGRFRVTKFLSNFLLTSFLRLFNLHDYYGFAEIRFSLWYLRRKAIPSLFAPNAKHRSFTNYKKKKTAGGVYVKLSKDELEQMESTSECLCVSVKMPGFKIEDVKLFFENNNNALVIEGKTDTEHYLAGFHIPEGYETEIGNIKTEMHQGVYKATLPCKQKEGN